MRSISAILLFVLLASCSSPRPAPSRKDAVLSGQETAEAAGEAAKKAEKEEKTGLIVASSDGDADSSTEADEPASQPAASSVLVIRMVKGTPTMNGEPIGGPDGVGGVVAGAVEANPEVIVIIERDETTGPRAIEAVMEEARTAGATNVEERPVFE